MIYKLILLISSFLCITYYVSLAQNGYHSKNKYVVLNLDGVKKNNIGHTFFKTIDKYGKIAYILNIRYKTSNQKRRYKGESADLVFTFYVFPGNDKLSFFKVKDTNSINKLRVRDVNRLENYLQQDSGDSFFEFEPVIVINGEYLQFAHQKVFGQAFTLFAEHRYFPQYTRFSNKFQLNLFEKPYTKAYMDSIRKETLKDTTTLYPFDLFLDYDKWYVDKIDKRNGIIKYWTNVSPREPNAYSFGRISSEISYRLNAGVIGFSLYPSYDFNDEYFKANKVPVRFEFEEEMDLRNTLLISPIVSKPKKTVPMGRL